MEIYLKNDHLKKKIFDWILHTYNHLNQRMREDEDVTKHLDNLNNITKSHIKELVNLDKAKTNDIIDIMFDGDHELTLQALSDQPKDKYEYLKTHFEKKKIEIEQIFK